MTKYKKKCKQAQDLFFLPLLFLFFFKGSALIFAAENVLQGTIIDGRNSKPIPSALVIAKESGLVSATNQNGTYRIVFPGPGVYTVLVKAPGLNDMTASVVVEGVVTRDFTLSAVVGGAERGSLVVKGNRDIQKISRQTMTVKEIKEVPATFGDSLNALTALAGINRAGGFFGPLIIRGASDAYNAYYLDGIPLFKVMHFGGIHSVIANNLMSSIDVYSSAFPAEFIGPQAAVININTVDEVQKEGGYADVGIISANALVQFPITRTTYVDGKEQKENRGYVIASGRVGYLSLVIPYFYEYVMNQELDFLPQYWDYQFKARYDLSKKNSLIFLAFGSRDTIDLRVKENWIDPSDDPYMAGLRVSDVDQSHAQALTYRFKPGDKLTNSLLAFSALNESDALADVASASPLVKWAHDLNIISKPYIFGLKDTIVFDWLEQASLRISGGVQYYLFKTEGNTISPKSNFLNLSDPDFVELVPLGETYKNLTFSGYAENKFTFGGFVFTPGIAFNWLERNGKYYADPRGVISYTFWTGTTIGAAGGYYSMFIQTAPELFRMLPNMSGFDFGPQRAMHRSVSIEQETRLFTLRVEGYYNNFWNTVNPDSYYDGSDVVACFTNNGREQSFGIEFSVKINNEEEQGPFGYFSYTYNEAKQKTNQSDIYSSYYSDGYPVNHTPSPSPPYYDTKPPPGNRSSGSQWVRAYYDMTHVIKLVAGYTFGKNTLSAKFQYNTATPFTPTVSSYEDVFYNKVVDTTRHRHERLRGKPNSMRLDPEYRLDVRYSRTTNYKWGYVSWYVEVIGIVTSPAQDYKWDYRYQYDPNNNPSIVRPNRLSIIPNFGIETKF
ncbi:MAG: carboxypeptidase-like regulatory domain-containing protein [Leptospirales bacterium]|nr:carboxypeptidase-like regulatory domain-containing protein [Leptospirales bacterium]